MFRECGPGGGMTCTRSDGSGCARRLRAGAFGLLIAAAGCGDTNLGGGDDAGAGVGAEQDRGTPLSAMEVLGPAQALGVPTIDASPDEAGNVWAVAPDALYIRRAGTATFRRYANAEGLQS